MSVGAELFKLYGLIGMQGVEKTQKQLKGIDKQARKTEKEIHRLGVKAQNVGKIFLKAFTLPLAIAGAAVVKFNADFHEAMTSSLAIMGDLSDSMRKDLEKAAIDVSKVVSFSAKEAAEAYFFLASAGKKAAQSIKLLPLVAKFAQAGSFGLALATDLLTDAQSALGLSSKDVVKDMENMTRVSDVLVKANTIANATVQQFSESLTNKAGAALRILKKDIEEGAAVLAVFADQGLKGAAAGESLNIVMRDFQRASLKNKEAFKQANVAVFDQNGNMRNMADIVGDLDKLLVGMSDAQRRATLSALGFQDKSISATMALLGTSEAIRGYEKDLRSAAGITDEVAAKQLKTFWKQLGLLKDRLIAVTLEGRAFGEMGTQVIIPVLSKLVSWVEALGKWWNGLSSEMRKTIGGFVALAAAIGPTVFVMGKLIAWSKVFIPILVILKSATLSYAGVVLALKNAVLLLQGSMLGITALIGSLVAIGWYWYSNWEMLSVQIKAQWARMLLTVSKGSASMLLAISDLVIGSLGLLDKLSVVVPGLGAKIKKATIGLLEFKAAIYKDLGKQQQHTNMLLEQGKATKTLTESIKETAEAAKEALGIKEATIEKSRVQIGVEKATAKAAGDTTDEIKRYNKSILAQTKEIGLNKKELLALERKNAIEEAKALGADVLAVKALYTAKHIELLEDEQEAINEYNAKTKAAIKNFGADKLALLEVEKQAELLKADELGADKSKVVELYALKEQKLKDELRDEEEKKDKQAIQNRLRQTSSIGNKINGILGKFASNKLQRLDNSEKREIESINNSQMNEEQKAEAIQKVQERTEKRRRVLERERAMREKAAALFNIAINTASAVIEALPNVPLSLFVGGLGLAEAVAVASTPMPFFDGGLIKGSDQGIQAQVGEKGQDELIFPVDRGIGMIVDGIVDAFSNLQLPSLVQPELAGVGGNATEVHMHLGTFIGDARSLKEFERKLSTVRISENQRKGF